MPPIDPPFLEGVFDAVDAGLIVLESDERVIGWNRWMAEAAGITVAEAAGRRLEDIFPELSNARLMGAVSDALQYGVSSVLSHSLHPTLFPLHSRAGRGLIHNVAVRPISQHPARALVQVTDVTVATERDRILRERQNARYNAVVESAPDVILTLDAECVIQMANSAAAGEFGYTAAELIGRPVRLLFRDREPWASTWAALLGGVSLRRPVQLVAQRKDGTPSFLEISASQWRSDARVFVTAILRDVNERRAAEEAMQRLNQTLEQRVAERTADRDRMWRLSTDVMLVAHVDGTISSTNPAWKHLLGWDEPTLIGAPLRDFVVPEDHGKLQSALGEMASSRVPRLFELRVLDQDGGSRQIAWSAVAAGELVQAVGRDVTAEREAEIALARAEEALRQSQKMEALGQLTGGIAHDFNNLLTTIIGAMNILKRRISARQYDDVDRFTDAAVASANRAAALTHRLLAFARRQPLDPQPININQLIEGMEELLRRSVGEQVRLEIGLARDAWPALSDGNQLENALLNLAINSRDAMPQGGRLTVETANMTVGQTEQEGHDDIEPGDYTVISVSDTGTGMTPETLAKVFDPFFTTKPIGQGTGLGLSMIYGFAKQSRGHVRITSEVGQGTAVRLLLPRHHGVSRPGVAAVSRKPAPAGAGETVLLVEDDPSVRLLIAEVLRELGYASVGVTDGHAALPILASDSRLDLLITDVGLPGMNGRQLAEIAREHRPDLQILFVTAYAGHGAERSDFLAPGMEMMTKPFALEALALKIREMIGAGRP